uniref:Sulfur carrier protein adenylyltransferase ThiF n=1 Tax=uncultured bacterium B19D1_C12D4_E9D6 TaxID=1329637 RepID=S4W6F0_9BACT|nr:sulfur carrier protein adenylyltransferase ThiF [uncultured bacterium B19D1_C12D4_E9D6]
MNNISENEFLERYSRQIKLPHVGLEGQQKIQDASVLIVGMGGLGSPVAMYLAAAGVGHLSIADFDVVEASNLQRQIAHRHADIGLLKTESAEATLKAINPDIQINRHDFTLETAEINTLAREHTLLCDCTDNFPTRFQLNNASLASKTPLVSGAAIRWEGQVTAFNPNVPNSPCYQCLYPDQDVEAASCAAEGVISPLVGVIGAMQALEVINILIGHGQLHGAVWLFDARFMEWQKMVLPKNSNCPACGSGVKEY